MSFKRIEDAEGVDLNQQGDRYRAREAIARLLAPWCAARSMSEVADARTRFDLSDTKRYDSGVVELRYQRR